MNRTLYHIFIVALSTLTIVSHFQSISNVSALTFDEMIQQIVDINKIEDNVTNMVHGKDISTKNEELASFISNTLTESLEFIKTMTPMESLTPVESSKPIVSIESSKPIESFDNFLARITSSKSEARPTDSNSSIESFDNYLARITSEPTPFIDTFYQITIPGKMSRFVFGHTSNDESKIRGDHDMIIYNVSAKNPRNLQSQLPPQDQDGVFSQLQCKAVFSSSNNDDEDIGDDTMNSYSQVTIKPIVSRSDSNGDSFIFSLNLENEYHNIFQGRHLVDCQYLAKEQGSIVLSVGYKTAEKQRTTKDDLNNSTLFVKSDVVDDGNDADANDIEEIEEIEKELKRLLASKDAPPKLEASIEEVSKTMPTSLPGLTLQKTIRFWNSENEQKFMAYENEMKKWDTVISSLQNPQDTQKSHTSHVSYNPNAPQLSDEEFQKLFETITVGSSVVDSSVQTDVEKQIVNLKPEEPAITQKQFCNNIAMIWDTKGLSSKPHQIKIQKLSDHLIDGFSIGLPTGRIQLGHRGAKDRCTIIQTTVDPFDNSIITKNHYVETTVVSLNNDMSSSTSSTDDYSTPQYITSPVLRFSSSAFDDKDNVRNLYIPRGSNMEISCPNFRIRPDLTSKTSSRNFKHAIRVSIGTKYDDEAGTCGCSTAACTIQEFTTHDDVSTMDIITNKDKNIFYLAIGGGILLVSLGIIGIALFRRRKNSQISLNPDEYPESYENLIQ